MTRVVVPRVSGTGSSQARQQQQQQQQGSIPRPQPLPPPHPPPPPQQQQQQEPQEREALADDNGLNINTNYPAANQGNQFYLLHACPLQEEQQQPQQQGSPNGSTSSSSFSPYFYASDVLEEGEGEKERGANLLGLGVGRSAGAGGGGGGAGGPTAAVGVGSNLAMPDQALAGRPPSSRDRRGDDVSVMPAGTTTGMMTTMMIVGQKRLSKESNYPLSLNESALRDDVAVAQPSDRLFGHPLHQQELQGDIASAADVLGGMTTATRQADSLSRLQTHGGCCSGGDQGETRRSPTLDELTAGSSGCVYGMMDGVAAAQPLLAQAGGGAAASERDRDSGSGTRQASGGGAGGTSGAGGGAAGGAGGGLGSGPLAGDAASTPSAAGIGVGLLSSGGKSNGASGGGGVGGGVLRRFDGPSTSSIGRQPSGRRPLNSVHTTPRASARSSPAASRCSSPRGDGDGYNSADEYKSSWTPSGIGYGGPDYDEELERKFEAELKRSRNLEVRRIVPDGNCLFRAIADQVYGDQDMHNDARQMCIDYMEKERDHFSQFVTESFTAYCKRKKKDKVHGNNLEMQAMAEMYNRPIQVFSYSTEPINIFHGSYQTDLPPILLSYHRGNHYNSLYDPSNPTVGAGLGFGHLRGHRLDKQMVKAAIKAQQDDQIEKAMVAEGRYYSDLELTEKEIERAVMEASRAEYLAHHGCVDPRHMLPNDTSSSSSGGATQASSSSPLLLPTSRGSSGEGSERVTPRGGVGIGRSIAAASGGSPVGASGPSGTTTAPGTAEGAASGADGGGVGGEITQNARMLMSMGFSYVRVMEAQAIFHDHLDNMLCFLLESDSQYSRYENMYKMKGKAVERSG